MSEFKERLRIAMNNKHINANQLGEKTGIPRSIIYEYLQGKYKAKQDKVYILAITLDVSPSWLMGIDEPDLTRNKQEEIKKRIDELNDTQLDQLIKVMDAMFNSK